MWRKLYVLSKNDKRSRREGKEDLRGRNIIKASNEEAS